MLTIPDNANSSTNSWFTHLIAFITQKAAAKCICNTVNCHVDEYLTTM